MQHARWYAVVEDNQHYGADDSSTFVSLAAIFCIKSDAERYAKEEGLRTVVLSERPSVLLDTDVQDSLQ